MHRDGRSRACINRSCRAVLSNGEHGGDLGSRLFSQTLAFLTEKKHRVCRQVEGLDGYAARQVVDTDQHDVIRTTPVSELRGVLVMMYVLISISDHCTATIPSLASDDVHLLCEEGICGSHDGTNVEVMIEVLDGYVKWMSLRIEISHDCLKSPVPVLIDDISAVTLFEQLGIESFVIRPRQWMRTYTV